MRARAERRRFRGLFGVSPKARAKVWALIESAIPSRSTPQRLLWALLFLNVYASEHAHSLIAHVDEKTFRKWAWLIVPAIAGIHAVRLLLDMLIPRAPRAMHVALTSCFFADPRCR